MVKKYYPGETKQQRKIRKAREKATGVKEPVNTTKVEKPTEQPVQVQTPQPVSPAVPIKDEDRWAVGFEPDCNRYVACLKHGNKYSSDYVNTLYSMVKRNLTLPFKFVCFTENGANLHPDIIVHPLMKFPNVSGWWYKPGFFNPDIPFEGTLLYLDLDVIVFRNIDNLFTYHPGKFCVIRDFNRINAPGWNKMNSSVFRLQIGSMPYVYKEFMKAPEQYTKKFHGDQDWLYHMVKKDFVFWPEDWIQSYKWEMRKKAPMNRIDGVRNFVTPGEPDILPNTNIAVFHGEPNPHNCVDNWCKENWK
jgi:hypothetical protein